MPVDDLTKKIRQRAYALWEEAGRPSGLDKDHWLQAERECREAAAREQAEDDGATGQKESRRTRKSRPGRKN
jgi:hypothetical protein